MGEQYMQNRETDAAATYAMSHQTSREILAGNLRRLMDARPDLDSTPAVERATDVVGCKIGKSTVDRVLRGEAPFNLDYLDALGRVFGVDAWQLLVPNMHPKNPPVLRSIGETEDQLYQRIGALVREAAKLEETK